MMVHRVVERGPVGSFRVRSRASPLRIEIFQLYDPRMDSIGLRAGECGDAHEDSGLG